MKQVKFGRIMLLDYRLKEAFSPCSCPDHCIFLRWRAVLSHFKVVGDTSPEFKVTYICKNAVILSSHYTSFGKTTGDTMQKERKYPKTSMEQGP